MTVRDKLQAVKTTVKMVDVLRMHGIIVPADAQSQISCPFHGADTHPSARVYAQTNTLFCWTCHKLWDVIAAEMQFTGSSLTDAVDALIVTFVVPVAEQPQSIQRFYTHAARYQYGDKLQSTKIVNELGDRFRLYYQSLPDWRLLEHLIDYFWQEFDEMVLDEVPVQLIDRATAWFSRAHAMLAAQVPTVEAINKSARAVVYVSDEEAESEVEQTL